MTALPNELWLLILEAATVVPSELNSNATSIFERCTHIEAQRAREVALPTRRAFPLVSRSFYAMATPLLYQSILIKRGKAARLLLETLKDTAVIEQPNEEEAPVAGLGRWTKRLDIDIQRPRTWNQLPQEELFSLLPFMPNLEILVGFGTWELLPDDRLLKLGLLSCRNLKMLYLPSDMLPKYEDAIFQLVTTTPLQSSLRVFYPNHPGYLPFDLKPVLGYSDSEQCIGLRALTASDAWVRTHAATDSKYFPFLCTLHVFGDSHIPLLETHGYKIVTLDIEMSRWETSSNVVQYLPNLRDLVMDIESVRELAQLYERTGESVPSHLKTNVVKRVGLTVNATQAPHSHYSVVFRLIPVLFPKLQKLRILERLIVNTLVKQPGRTLRWHAELAERGIRLEREDGDSILAGWSTTGQPRVAR